jgi:hypothetical protein
MIPALSFLRMGGARIENAIRSAITAGGGLDLRLPVGSAQNYQFLGSRTPKALIGATERAGNVGRTVLWNLLSSPFGGREVFCACALREEYWMSRLPKPAA